MGWRDGGEGTQSLLFSEEFTHNFVISFDLSMPKSSYVVGGQNYFMWSFHIINLLQKENS